VKVDEFTEIERGMRNDQPELEDSWVTATQMRTRHLYHRACALGCRLRRDKESAP